MAAAAASGGAEPMKDANVADEPLAQQREKETDGTTEGGQEGPAVAREVKEGKEGGSKEEGSSGVEAGGEKDDDDEGCGFCKFMRAGPCGHVFTVRYHRQERKWRRIARLLACSLGDDGPKQGDRRSPPHHPEAKRRRTFILFHLVIPCPMSSQHTKGLGGLH